MLPRPPRYFYVYRSEIVLIHRSPARELRPHSLPVHPHQCLLVFDGFVPHLKYNICHVLWCKPPDASLRCCRSSSIHENQVRLFCIRRNGPVSTNRTSRARPELLGTSKHRTILPGGSHRRTHVYIRSNWVDPSQPFTPLAPRTRN